jgi:hypothetical protein
MAIYFGNLDRELADRQNVLKEDAARQYRGSRDMMESFSDLGKTVERGMKDYSTAKLEAAKLNYNIERNKESDQIRKLSFQQSTKRNKELTLDSQLRNVEKFRATSVANHIGKQWYWRDPKAVRTAYDDRMKIFTADQVNIDAEQRIKAYPHLFGKKGLESLTYYEDLLKLKEKDGNSAQITDEDLKAARNNLPVAPLGFKDWAINAELFNEKITGNPGRTAGAMQTTILRNAGYNIPDATELNERTQRENGVLQAGVTEEKIQSDKSLAEKELEVMGRNIIHKKKGIKVETSKTNELKKKAIEGRDYEILPDGTIWDLLHGQNRDSIEDVYKFMPVTSQTSDISSDVEVTGFPGPSAGGFTKKDIILNQEKAEAQKIVDDIKIDQNALRYRLKSQNSPGYPGNQANAFTIAAEAPGPSTLETVDKKLRSWGLYGRTDKAAKDMIEEGKIIDTTEFRERIASRDREEGVSGGERIDTFDSADYSKRPNYSTWENVSKKEKAAILKHKETTEFGASPKSVAGLIKAENELKQINKELHKVNTKVSKYSNPDIYNPNEKWKRGEQKTDYLVQDSEEFFIPSVSSDISPGGGAMSAEARAAIGIATGKTAPPALLMELSGLENKKNALLGNLEFAQSNVNETQTKGVYNPKATRDWGDPSVLSPSAARIASIPKTITPEVKPKDFNNEMGRPITSSDLGYQAAVRANYAEDTQKEIIGGIIDREGWGPADAGYSYFDGGDPDERGYYKEGGGESLTLAGGNNIYDTINSMSAKERKIEMEEVATAMFGNGGVRRKEFIRFMNMPKKDHKKEYDSIVKRGRLRLTEGQRDYLTGYSYRNHLNRLVKNYPYLSDIAQYPKEMQVFLMDNAFNMGPKWLSKFKKTEVHLKNWVTKGRKTSDLEKMKEEYKNSDHYRETTRAQDLVAMLTIN